MSEKKDLKEALIELIDKRQVYGIDNNQPKPIDIVLLDNEELADHLIENGVVIIDPQKYPPVTNRGIIDTVCGMPLDEVADLIKAKQEGRIVKQSEGEWIEHEDDWCGTYYTCSVCKCDWTTIDGTPHENNMRYCPECGSKMKGGE